MLQYNALYNHATEPHICPSRRIGSASRSVLGPSVKTVDGWVGGLGFPCEGQGGSGFIPHPAFLSRCGWF